MSRFTEIFIEAIANGLSYEEAEQLANERLANERKAGI